MFIGLSPSGKATGFDPVIRWFESSQPSQSKKSVRQGGFFYWVSWLGERSKVRSRVKRADAAGGPEGINRPAIYNQPAHLTQTL